jgi:hypothetical protein
MKTKLVMKSISVFAILIFAASVSFASVNKGEPTTELTSIIKSYVTYPEWANEKQITGFVVVSFKLDENGKINVTASNANSYLLQDYVEAKLKEIKIEDPKKYSDKTQYLRFDFEIIK